MSGTDSGLRFWLSYVEHRGGLVDTAIGGSLAVLPQALQTDLGLPETLTVTGDPEAAREDGALLLAAGHPVLARSAEAVLAGGDAGQGTLAWPGEQLPATADLIEQARDTFPVDHGRIDPAETPTRAYLPVLRVGAMIHHVVAGDEAFQEQAECWLDADLCRELPDADRVVVDRAWAADAAAVQYGSAPSPTPGATPVLPCGLDHAVEAAHGLLHARAGRRLHALTDDARQAREAEITRTESYYRDVLDGIERRRAGTAPDRLAALDARAEATRQERARRLAEIKEKHRARFELTPYRLHLLHVPAVVVPVDVMRGSRRYPQRLVWIWPARRFRALPCPSCGSDRPLVAGKASLGCEGCLSRPTATPPATKARPAPKSPAAPERPAPAKRPAAAERPAAPVRPPAPAARKPPATASPSPSHSPSLAPSPAQIRTLGDQLAMTFWQSVVDNDRRLFKRLLPNSPAATALRLFGVRGLTHAIGIPPATTLVSVSGGAYLVATGPRFACRGQLQTREHEAPFPFALIWRLQGNQAIVDELLPHMSRDPNLFPYAWVGTPATLRHDRLPGSRTGLDPVAARLTDVILPVEGLPLLLRCLTAWWRLDVPLLTDPAPEPGVMAAALLRLVSWRCGSRIPTAECAERFMVTVARIKAAEAGLKGQLRLGPETVW